MSPSFARLRPARDRARGRVRAPVVAGDRPRDGHVALGPHRPQRARPAAAVGRAHQHRPVDGRERLARRLDRLAAAPQLLADPLGAVRGHRRVRVGVVADRVPRRDGLADQRRLARRPLADQEERRLRAVAREQLEQPRRLLRVRARRRTSARSACPRRARGGSSSRTAAPSGTGPGRSPSPPPRARAPPPAIPAFAASFTTPPSAAPRGARGRARGACPRRPPRRAPRSPRAPPRCRPARIPPVVRGSRRAARGRPRATGVVDGGGAEAVALALQVAGVHQLLELARAAGPRAPACRGRPPR